MYVILVMSLTGAILDPFLIFGLGRLPMLGIFGAAISAVISYFLASLLSLYYLRINASKYNLSWSHMIPNLSIIASIYQTGFPSVIMNFVYSIVMIVYNHVLGTFGPMAIAALGLCFRINHLVIMVLFGMGHGIMPIVGFSEGAALHKRLMETVNCAVKISVLFSATAFVLLEAFAHPILLLFTSDPELLDISVPAVRIFATMLLLVGPNLVWINMFIGLGKGLTSMLLLMMRDTLLLIPMLLYLPSLFGLTGVWVAQPIANLLAFFVILYWKKREFRMIEEKI
jgi:putative MATE family efflux protein